MHILHGLLNRVKNFKEGVSTQCPSKRLGGFKPVVLSIDMFEEQKARGTSWGQWLLARVSGITFYSVVVPYGQTQPQQTLNETQFYSHAVD
jgi:hypothetical protein